MKYIWEDKDIVNGRWAARSVGDRVEVVCIVWVHQKGGPNKIGLCCINTDGLVYFPHSVKDSLNSRGYRPYDGRPEL